MLNVDEILRIPSTKLLVSIRGNKPLLLDKIIYKEHPLYKKLKDSPISEYNPNWIKNQPVKTIIKENNNKSDNKEKVSWDTF